MARVLIIEQDSKWQNVLLRGLGKAHEGLVWPDGEVGVLAKVTREAFDIILLNLMNDERVHLIEKICKISPSTPVIVPSGRPAAQIPPEHLRFFQSLVLYHETEEFVFVHAGLRHGVEIDDGDSG